jgi:hypothetical protein
MDDRLETLARLPGRGGGAAISPRVGVAGGCPKESRPLLGAVAEAVTCPCRSVVELMALMELPPPRFLLLRTVTDDGM